MKKIRIYLLHLLVRLIKYNNFNQVFLKSLPARYHAAARFLYFMLPSAEEKRIARNIERFRSSIPVLAKEKKIYSYTSPHSNTFQKDEKGNAVPGSYVGSTVEAHMRTGISTFNGILLRRIVAGAGVKSILELGTNTGFSGCYFLSVPGAELTTIEGSEALCDIAAKNMSRISPNYRIMNMLFDDAIDQLLRENASFDCVFIDGQHEQEATLHYTERVLPLLNPGSLIIHDDIYWSDDMNQAWQKLCQSSVFSETIDFLYKGVCVVKGNGDKSVHYDLGNYLPRPRIQKQNW